MSAPAPFAAIGADQNRQMAVMIAISAAVHVLLFAMLIFWPGDRSTHLGFNVIPVDLVPMSPMPKGKNDGDAAYVPEKKEPEKEDAAPEPAPPPKPEPKKPDELPAPVEKAPKLIPKKDEPKPEPRLTLEEKIAKIRGEVKDREQIGDPEGQPGTQAYPGEGGLKNRIVNIYLSKVKEKVERNWIRPPGIPPGQRLQVSIRFQIDERGGVINPRRTKSSGIMLADKSCMQALIKAAPFERPTPVVLQNLREEGGIELTFELSR